ncbi:MAG TPA: hypothetical protein VLW25_08570 [Bryobacteraceae bacterium]|jgi:hypothetical protein|nr:hypothetical protein [Bryobacteraceae bacterium]
MKRLCLAVGLLAALFSTGLQAQVLDSEVKVPFDFWLGQKLMPAGGYLIFHEGNGAVLVRGEDGKRAANVFLPASLLYNQRPSEPRLQFTRYANTYFLSKIWNIDRGFSVPKSSREKELARRGVPSKTEDITLATK